MSENLNLKFAHGGAQFTVELLEKLIASDSQENIVISPFSIQMCMALAYAGAQGDTADEIANALKYNTNSASEVAQAFQVVSDQYRKSELLKIANKIYIKEGRRVKPEYAAIVQNKYQAQIESINFLEKEAAAQTINSWVSNATAGKINKLISSDILNDDTRLVLLNALHFKAEWANKFDKAKTVEDDFWITPEQAIKLKYMQQTTYVGNAYLYDYNCYALEMPYKDSDLSMFVLLPDKEVGLTGLANQMKNINLIDLSEKLPIDEAVVKFPKFIIEYSVEIKEVLQEVSRV